MRNRARSYTRYSRFPREHFLTIPGQARGTAPGKRSPDARSSSVGAIRPSWLTRTLAWASAGPYARRSATRAVPLHRGARIGETDAVPLIPAVAAHDARAALAGGVSDQHHRGLRACPHGVGGRPSFSLHRPYALQASSANKPTVSQRLSRSAQRSKMCLLSPGKAGQKTLKPLVLPAASLISAVGLVKAAVPVPSRAGVAL